MLELNGRILDTPVSDPDTMRNKKGNRRERVIKIVMYKSNPQT